jgi:hypothetical protein
VLEVEREEITSEFSRSPDNKTAVSRIGRE